MWCLPESELKHVFWILNLHVQMYDEGSHIAWSLSTMTVARRVISLLVVSLGGFGHVKMNVQGLETYTGKVNFFRNRLHRSTEQQCYPYWSEWCHCYPVFIIQYLSTKKLTTFPGNWSDTTVVQCLAVNNGLPNSNRFRFKHTGWTDITVAWYSTVRNCPRATIN
jgi:hypothetical protein